MKHPNSAPPSRKRWKRYLKCWTSASSRKRWNKYLKCARSASHWQKKCDLLKLTKFEYSDTDRCRIDFSIRINRASFLTKVPPLYVIPYGGYKIEIAIHLYIYIFEFKVSEKISSPPLHREAAAAAYHHMVWYQMLSYDIISRDIRWYDMIWHAIIPYHISWNYDIFYHQIISYRSPQWWQECTIIFALSLLLSKRRCCLLV
jgi:hypothetical protein